MRASEFITEDSGATVSGGIATVAQPMGLISRTQKDNTAKYANSFVPEQNKRKKKHVSR